MSLLCAFFIATVAAVSAGPAIVPVAYNTGFQSTANYFGRSLAYSAPLLANPQFVAAAPVAYSAPFLQSAPVVARAAPVVTAAAAPVAVARLVETEAEPIDTFPQYQYAYNVQDAITGDSKTQEETREGDVVKGSYSLIEPDGSRRTVNYYADDINGFNAIVEKDVPVAVSPVIAAKTVVAPAVETVVV